MSGVVGQSKRESAVCRVEALTLTARGLPRHRKG